MLASEIGGGGGQTLTAAAGSSFATATAIGSSLGLVPAPTARSDFRPVFSLNVGGVFLVGGKDATTGQSLNEVQLFRFGGVGWSTIVPEEALATVDAATYSVADGRLWVLDHRRERGLLSDRTIARLLRIDPWTTATEVLGHWSWDQELWGQHFLALDRDGHVLLLASSRPLCRSRVARLRVDERGEAYAELIEDDLPYTTDEPMVDKDEYGFIVRGSDGTVSSIVRRSDLRGKKGRHSIGRLFDRGLLGDLLAPVQGLIAGQDCGCEHP